MEAFIEFIDDTFNHGDAIGKPAGVSWLYHELERQSIWMHHRHLPFNVFPFLALLMQ